MDLFALATTIIYILLHLLTVTIAFYAQNWGNLSRLGRVARWFGGMFCVTILNSYKVFLLLPLVSSAQLYVYALTALWECSNGVLVFGGRSLFEKLGITSLKRAWIKAFVPCQVKFVEEQKSNSKWLRTAYLTTGLAVGYFLYIVLRSNASLVANIQNSIILETETFAIITSLFVLLFDLTAHLFQIGLDGLLFFTGNHDFKVQVIMPYGCIYFSKSGRDFWSKWSRPAGQLIRFMVYYPLGGSKRWYISIPIMFFINAYSHFGVSFALVNDSAYKGWLAVFGILGTEVTLEILVDRWMMVKKNDNVSGSPTYVTVTSSSPTNASVEIETPTNVPVTSSSPTNTTVEIETPTNVPVTSSSPTNATVVTSPTIPFWYKFARGVVAHVTFRIALFIFIHQCMKLDLASF